LTPDDQRRCRDAAAFQRIHDAYVRGDMDALRAAEEDADVTDATRDLIGSPLVYAVYHSPRAFIRALLEQGADPRAPVDDGFPPLIAALATGRAEPGVTRRTDTDDVVRLLLRFGADPHQRGINDYTALHMAVGERRPIAVQWLLDAGADPDLRTRIDAHDTPLEMARGMGLDVVAGILERRGAPAPQRMRSGLTLLLDIPGEGPPVRRLGQYDMRIRIWLHRGEPVRWTAAGGVVGASWLEDDGETLYTRHRLDRHSFATGFVYGMTGMRVGGLRRFEIAPHLAYGAHGVPGIIPPHALLKVEIGVLSAVG
jgi:hypothetical protein